MSTFLTRQHTAPLAGLFLWAAVLLVGCSPSDPPAEILMDATSGLLITDVTLISPHLEEPLEGAWVGILGDRISHVGSGPVPKDTISWPRISGEGLFLTPGLIDSHVHLGSVPGMSWDHQQKHEDLVDAYFRQLPRSYLYHGFTTLIDLAPRQPGDLDSFRERPLAPDVFGCGSPIPIANGYPMVFVPERFRFEAFPNFLYDPRQTDAIPSSVEAEDHSPPAIVERIASGEGLCVKAFVEDGFGLAKTWPVPTVPMLEELKEASHRADLPLLMHANSLDSYRLALDGGTDVIVHGLWTWDAAQAADDGESLPPDLVAIVERLVQDRTAVMPTLQVLVGDRALFDSAFLDDPALSQVIPRELLDWYRSAEGGWFARQVQEGLPPEASTPKDAREGHDRAISRVERVTAAMIQAGSPILFGSDTPSGPSYGNPPGYNGYLELRRLEALGMPLDALLAAATQDNARAFGLEDRYGSVEVGKVANLLLLRQNPLETVDAYDQLDKIVLRGQLVERHTLTADHSP